ncbi:siderophore ABC transporter substrate-binding protein [Dermabacter hominis]|uniref:siderophore ABC transporter substrate-binding protein n=1 Tax=Dermabacter hominis TaxID=36740 RepID=UPI002432680F|nr:ABC transporter substrate-binding protein [Dermabacter hominis]
MMSMTRRELGIFALAACSAGALASCGSASSQRGGSSGSDSGGSGTRTVTDARGSVEVPTSPKRIGATDNRIFRTLEAWGIELVVAPRDLMPEGVSYRDNEKILNTGSHREPDLEQFVAADPDLVLNGQRYAQYYDDIKALAPKAAIVDTDIDIEKKPLDDELKRQITLLGATLGHETEAQKLIEAFEAAIERVKAAYSTDDTVMGLVTSGGTINYAAPKTGRAVGPLFPLLGLTPALDVEGTSDHKGDDVSLEAIAAANPDWIIVMDRDAAVAADEEGYRPAAELIEKAEALSHVTAITEGNVVYMPATFYTTEDIQAYTEVLGTFASALEAKKN